jgi:peptide/nickel transport system substrate-binding protein
MDQRLLLREKRNKRMEYCNNKIFQEEKMSKKRLCLLACVIFMSVLLISGCNVKGEESKKDQVLNVAIGTDINTWNITKFPAGDARFVWAQIYETLVRLDSDLNLVPGLAESWESQEDRKVWIFKLRQGVTFHDGTPLTAEAVKFSYGDKAYVTKVKLLQFENIEAIDDYTVKFTSSNPIQLPTYMTHIAWPVVSPTSVSDTGEFIKPIGTGPFEYNTYSKGQEVILDKNENYWGEEPKLNQVVFKIVPDASTRIMALTSGDIDMSLKIPESDVAQLEANKDINVNRKLSTFTDFLQFNCAKAPFDDVNVRKAVANAIDTENIVKNVLNSVGVAAQGRPYSPIMMYVDKDLPLYSQNLDDSKALLEAAGWKDLDGDKVREKDGQPLNIVFLVGQSWSPRELKIAEVCQAQLAEVGFSVEVKQVETAAFTELEKAGDFDVLMRTGYYVWGPYPYHVKVHFSKNFASHYSNPAYDQLVIEGENTNDETKKEEIYKNIQNMIIDEVPAFYLLHEEKIVATQKNVMGYEISAEDPWLELKTVYIK